MPIWKGRSTQLDVAVGFRKFEAAFSIKLHKVGRSIRIRKVVHALWAYPKATASGGGCFTRGKISFYRNLGKNKLAAAKWLEADGKVAEVPGVW